MAVCVRERAVEHMLDGEGGERVPGEDIGHPVLELTFAIALEQTELCRDVACEPLAACGQRLEEFVGARTDLVEQIPSAQRARLPLLPREFGEVGRLFADIAAAVRARMVGDDAAQGIGEAHPLAGPSRKRVTQHKKTLMVLPGIVRCHGCRVRLSASSGVAGLAAEAIELGAHICV